jgi:hypothetical protein
MRIVTSMLHVVVLVLMMIGVTIVGAYLGEILLTAHGGKFFDLKQQFLIAGMLVVLGTLLPLFSRFSIAELIITAAVAQVVVFAIIRSVGGEFDLLWVWRVTRFITLPFALSVALAVAVKAKFERGQQPSDDDILKVSPQK